MLDLIPRVELDAETSICIAAGMKQMAASDNELHEQEINLINSFIEESGTADPESSNVNLDLLHSQELKAIFLNSLAIVALADGTIRQEEKDLLSSYVERLAYDTTAEQILEEVARALLSQLKSSVIFREQVEAIGRNLGLSDAAIQDVLSS